MPLSGIIIWNDAISGLTYKWYIEIASGSAEYGN